MGASWQTYIFLSVMGTLSPGDFHIGRLFCRNIVYIFGGFSVYFVTFEKKMSKYLSWMKMISLECIKIWWNMLILYKNPVCAFGLNLHVPRRHKILLKSASWIAQWPNWSGQTDMSGFLSSFSAKHFFKIYIV